MGKLVQMDVLIVGLNGLGVETAKNLILAGPRSVTVWDNTPVTPADIGRNYYLNTHSIGQSRAAAAGPLLAELNPYVHVTALQAPALTEEIVSRFNVVVMTDSSRADALKWDAFCRSQVPAIGFISAEVRGVAGSVFVDFGEAFVMRDATGEANKSAIITTVTNGNPATVYTVDSKRHGFNEGDHVVFREVDGMPALNDGKPRKILSVKPFSFTIDEDTTAYGEHTVGGIVEQTKVPVTVSFAPLEERIRIPLPSDDPIGMLITPDLSKFGRSEQLHIAFQAIEDFRDKHGSLPALRNADHAAECVEYAKQFAARVKDTFSVESVDEAVVRNVALTAAAELPALAAFFGGIVAQEVVKFTGKFTPLRQWLFLDAFEVLPDDHEKLPAAEYTPAGNRYDNMVSIIGRTAQTAIMDKRVFVVGAGALGCEFLKNFAMMGVGCGPKGRITVTDMDRIEVSNLNRQFLFRSHNVGSSKSVAAAAAVQHMNGDLKVEALEIPVGDDTEATFNDAFWNNLDIVTNALDNLKARTYVDQRCIFYSKPLLESGTLGTKANTQVVVPRQTECYSDSVDPPEENIPMCTLRNFPHAIEHCIEWARDLFAGSFTNTVQEAASYLADPKAWLEKMSEEANLSSRRSKLQDVYTLVQTAQVADWKTCVRAARELFHNNFYLQIRQLLHNFPADYVDPATGMKFWSPPKRVPIPAVFDVHDPEHFSFVLHAAALVASNFGVPLPPDYDNHASLAAIVSEIAVPEFVPKNTRIKASETDTTVEGSDDDAEAIATLNKDLLELSTRISAGKALNLVPAEFEKDDDTNHHIDIITAAANLRARNYAIKEATRFEVKLTAGRIIPAVATTTCSVTGLVCVEFYKVAATAAVDKLRNSFINLAINMYSMAEPVGPKRTKSVDNDPITLGPVKAIPEGFTRWDRFVVDGNLTPVQLDAWLQKTHNVRISMISAGKLILYNPLLYKSHRETRANQALVNILSDISGKAPAKDYIMLDISAEDDEGDVVIPPVQLNFKSA